jgi:tetratricopeptide (TPR) repeat protein
LDPENPDDWKKLVTDEAQSSTLQAQRNGLFQFFSSLTPGTDNPAVWPYLSDLITTTLVFTAEGSDAVGFRLKGSSPKGDSASGVIAYVVKRGNQYLIAGLVNSNAPSVQAVASARAGNMVAARQWVDWLRESAGLSKLPDADIQPALDSISAQLLWSDGKPQEAAAILLRLHRQNPSAKATTILLTESLIQSNRIAEAKPYIENLEQSDPGAVPVLRLREHLSAQEGNYSEAAAIAKQVCAKPNASAIDWNDLAWTTLFTRQNAVDAQAAAEKAAQLTKFNSPPILHTLAIAQASASQVKDALSTSYKLSNISGDSAEMYSVFGRIAEEIGLPGVASGYYGAVPKDSASHLSNYSFAQLRLSALK